jgi:hypothetical protein
VRRLALRCVLAAALAASGAVRADAEVTFRADVDARKVGVEDQVQLTLTLEGAGGADGSVTPPTLKNLKVAAGPMISTQISVVNGAIAQTKTLTYVLQPVGVGPAEIGSARVKLASGEHATAAITLEIVPGSIVSRSPRRPTSPLGDPFGEDPFEAIFGRRGARRPPAKLMVEASPSRTRLHVGEPLVLTYVLYTQAPVTDLQLGDPPKYPGFWSEELPKPASQGGEVVVVDGERYQRFPFLQKLLFPTKAGSLTLPPATFRIGLQRGFFDVGGARAERATRPLNITVDPIPDEPGFSGAVGRFRVSASVDKGAVPLGEAATVRVRVEGSGNLKWIDRGPELAVPGAKVYPPQVKSDLAAGPSGISGSKTWEYVVIPETAGTLAVPRLAFSYFDPSAGRIVRADTEPLSLQVDAAPGGVPAAPVHAAAPARASGPRALRSDPDPPGRGLPAPGPRALGMAVFGALLLHGVLASGAWWADRRRAAAGRTASRRSVRGLLAELEQAGRNGVSKEASAAVIEKAFHELFGTIPEQESPADGERERAARAVLQEVRFLRYAPQLGDYTEKIREVAARAAEVVRRWA